MHDEKTQPVVRYLSELARMRAVRERADRSCRAFYELLERQGFGRRAVDRALNLMDADTDGEFSELQQAQEILAHLKSPVQLELVSMYETPVLEASQLRAIEDQGYWDRVQGKERRYKGTDEEKRAAYMRGWDAANSALEGGVGEA